MHLSVLLTISCVGCHLATAAPQHRISTVYNSADLDRSERDPKLLKFIHRLLHTLQNDYQDPNWPTNVQPKTASPLTDDCSEEENPSVEHDCDDDGDYSKEKKYKNQFDTYGVSYDNPSHVGDAVCLCDSNKHSEHEIQLQQAMANSFERKSKESSQFSINSENKKPKLIITSQNTHSVRSKAKTTDRRTLEELIHKRLSDLHLPRIQINQFGTNKVEQNLYHQLKTPGFVNKKQKEEMHKNILGYKEVINVQPHQVGNGKWFANDDDEPCDHKVGNTERTQSTMSNQHTKNKSLNEFRKNEPSPIITATQSNIKYSDVDINIGLNKSVQNKINVQPKQSNLPIVAQQHKNSNPTKEPNQPKRAHLPEVTDVPKLDDLPKVTDQHKVTAQPKVPDQQKMPHHTKVPLHSQVSEPLNVPDQPKVADQHDRPNQKKIPHLTKVHLHSQVSELPNVSDQPKVPDQPKIIIDDITEATTDHKVQSESEFTTPEDLSTQTDMMDKKIAVTDKNVSPTTDITTVPAFDDSTEINPEDATGQRSKRTKETLRNKSRRNRAGAITPTFGTPLDQDAEGTHYYPFRAYGVSDDRRHQKLMNPKARHGVPIAYESNPRASASNFQPNFYNPEYAKHLQRKAKSPSSSFFRASKDHFATIQHDMDYDDYADYTTQVSYPNRYRFNAPAATVNWNSMHKSRQENPVRSRLNSSHKFAKQTTLEEPQSIFEQDDFNEPELTAGWEDWEPNYNHDMLHDRSSLRTAERGHPSYNSYFI